MLVVRLRAQGGSKHKVRIAAEILSCRPNTYDCLCCSELQALRHQCKSTHAGGQQAQHNPRASIAVKDVVVEVNGALWPAQPLPASSC